MGTRVWRGGDEAGTVEKGIKILGTPFGQHVWEHQQTLLDRIVLIPCVQSLWALLFDCAAGANYFIQVVPLSCRKSLRRPMTMDVPFDACARSAGLICCWLVVGYADEAVLVVARRRKERTSQSWFGQVAELGWWCWQAMSLVMVRVDSEFRRTSALARSEPTILRKRAEQAWRMRWCCLFACAAARALAASLLERRAPGGTDGDTLSVRHVVNDWRFASLDLAA